MRMCGRVNVSDFPPIQELMEEVGLPIYPREDIYTSAKLFPYYKPLLTGFADADGNFDTALMQWGWKRDWDKGKRLFNSRRISAKGQAIWNSKVWGDSIRLRRCVIPVNAFYEWDENQPRGKRDRYRIEANDSAMLLGGIYEISSDGEMFMSICTTEPNSKMATIHHRMPVIIDCQDTARWLRSAEQQEIDSLMTSRPDSSIRLIKEN